MARRNLVIMTKQSSPVRHPVTVLKTRKKASSPSPTCHYDTNIETKSSKDKHGVIGSFEM
jgi:hypothetical protein